MFERFHRKREIALDDDHHVVTSASTRVDADNFSNAPVQTFDRKNNVDVNV